MKICAGFSFLKFSKRQKFIFLSLILAVASVILQNFAQIFYSRLILLGLAIFVTLWALNFDLKFPEQIIFPIYPVLLTLAFLLNSSKFLPSTVYRLPFTVLYALGVYILFLILNILNVATVRTVPLKKAALSTMYFVGMLINFFLIYGILATYPSFLPFTFYLLPFTFFLSFSLFYVIQIEPPVLKESEEITPPRPKLLFYESHIVALVGAQLGFVSSFWLKPHFLIAIFLSGLTFLIIGLLQHSIKKTLTKRIIFEHGFVAVFLILAFLLGS